VDALLVNTGATAMRPDKTKVSNSQTLQNMSVVLLKLCEPFMGDPSRIHPGFVWSPEYHGGIYAHTGDDAVSRLGDDMHTCTEPYDPKNKFIPQCFFLCVRSLHLSLVASSSYHTNLVRQVNHTAWSVRQRNEDVATDPNFNQILSMQFANEVSLLAPEMLHDALRFFNLSAGLLLQISDKVLPFMPEHMVDDICDFVVFVRRVSAKQMEGVDLSNIFKVVVKLLSPQYASVSQQNAIKCLFVLLVALTFVTNFYLRLCAIIIFVPKWGMSCMMFTFLLIVAADLRSQQAYLATPRWEVSLIY